MRKWLVSVLTLLVTVPGAAAAGPWPREVGQTFLSFNSQTSTPLDNFGNDTQTYYSLFLERGVAPDLTFGLDAGLSDGGAYSAIGYVKRSTKFVSDRHRLAWRLGLGAADDGSGRQLAALAGGSWGMGFETGFGPGWAVLDLQGHYLLETQDRILKADATVGVKPNDRLKLMLQLQSGDYPGSDPYLRLAPSLAWSIGPGRHIEVGTQVGLVGDDRVGIKLGSWVEF